MDTSYATTAVLSQLTDCLAEHTARAALLRAQAVEQEALAAECQAAVDVIGRLYNIRVSGATPAAPVQRVTVLSDVPSPDASASADRPDQAPPRLAAGRTRGPKPMPTPEVRAAILTVFRRSVDGMARMIDLYHVLPGRRERVREAVNALVAEGVLGRQGRTNSTILELRTNEAAPSAPEAPVVAPGGTAPTTLQPGDPITRALLAHVFSVDEDFGVARMLAAVRSVVPAITYDQLRATLDRLVTTGVIGVRTVGLDRRYRRKAQAQALPA